MSIKSDRWIRRMAEEHGMIEPFEPGQVRASADGQKIVSYGTSSYGYDIRCANEFKIFTDIHSPVMAWPLFSSWYPVVITQSPSLRPERTSVLPSLLLPVVIVLRSATNAFASPLAFF